MTVEIDPNQEIEISDNKEEPEKIRSFQNNNYRRRLEAFFIVKNILKDIVPITYIFYKDNERYMAILYKNKTTKWICRLYWRINYKSN